MKTRCILQRLVWAIAVLLAASAAQQAAVAGEAIKLSSTFKRLKAPETGRAVVQLTWGKSSTYPLYFFIPTITRDNKYLVYHKAEDGEVQLYRLKPPDRRISRS